MQKNRLSGSMQGRREKQRETGNCGLFNSLMPRPPTLPAAESAIDRMDAELQRLPNVPQ